VTCYIFSISRMSKFILLLTLLLSAMVFSQAETNLYELLEVDEKANSD